MELQSVVAAVAVPPLIALYGFSNHLGDGGAESWDTANGTGHGGFL